MEHGHNSGLSKQITLIIACDGNFNIGKDGTMLFHIPKDLARYKKITMGKNLYCGRKTFDDMGPLKGRRIIVLSRGEVPKALVMRFFWGCRRACSGVRSPPR